MSSPNQCTYLRLAKTLPGQEREEAADCSALASPSSLTNRLVFKSMRRCSMLNDQTARMCSWPALTQPSFSSALLTLGSRANLLLSSEAQTELAQVGPEIAAVSTADALRIFSAAALDQGASRGGEGSAQEPDAKVHGSGISSSIGPVVGAGVIDSLNAFEDSIRSQQNQSRDQSSELTSSTAQNRNERRDAGESNEKQGLQALESRVQSLLLRSNT